MKPQTCFARTTQALALSLALLATPAIVLAHAVITATSLQEQPVKPDSPTHVALFFNSNIEFKLSKVQLISKGDVHHPLVIKPGKKRGELLIHLPGLAVGEYVIRYKVFAADGHLTEDLLRFHVAP